MNRALYTAAAGMSARQLSIDTIANNLANLSTTGYKRRRAEFQDLIYQTLRSAGAPTSATTRAPAPLEVGLGVQPVATPAIHLQGDMKLTGGPLDVAIEGRGFFVVALPSGELGYTRAGAFQVSADGELVTPAGQPLEPAITVPEDATSVTIAQDGTVSALVPGDTELQVLGQIELAMFPNPTGLASLGDSLFGVTPGSGDPLTVAPGEQGAGTLSQGFLEGSNVDVMLEFVEMIQSQRAYEAIAKVLRSADEMYAAANNSVR
jgi:flagellar basal-body rod protein FlgG